MVQQASGRGHDDVHAAHQVGFLRVHVDAAEHAGMPQRQVLGVALDRSGDLVGQFARGRQDQAAHRVHGRRHAVRRVVPQAGNDGQGKRGRLAGTGLRGSQHVPSRQYFRNGTRLNRRRLGIAKFINRTLHFCGQTQLGKRHHKHTPRQHKKRRRELYAPTP